MKFQHREEHRDMLLGNVSWKFIAKQVASLALLLQGAMSVETPWANKQMISESHPWDKPAERRRLGTTCLLSGPAQVWDRHVKVRNILMAMYILSCIYELVIKKIKK